MELVAIAPARDLVVTDSDGVLVVIVTKRAVGGKNIHRYREWQNDRQCNG